MPTMHYTTRSLLKAVQNATETGSVYAACKALNTSVQSGNRWTHGRSMDDEYVLKSARYANLDPLHALVSIKAEREIGTPCYAHWLALAEALDPAKRDENGDCHIAREVFDLNP